MQHHQILQFMQQNVETKTKNERNNFYPQKNETRYNVPLVITI